MASINRIRLEFKVVFHHLAHSVYIVLIESDWNLKFEVNIRKSIASMVLIESDWNLKPYKPISDTMVSPCINRIRLEFKGQKTDRKNQNRKVLIESDWNLKYVWTIKMVVS